MNIFSGMRHTIMRSVSKKDHSRRTLCFIAMAIVACGLLIGCPEPAGDSGAPNLAITATVKPESVTIGGSATVTVTVTNNGTVASSPTMVDFYKSDDTTINTEDDKVGTQQTIPRLEPKATESKEYAIPASETGKAGMLHYGACIPAVGGSAARCSAAVPLMVTTDVPDLRVTAFTVTPNPVIAGNDVTVSITVVNDGAAGSAATTARLELYNFGGSNIPLGGTIMVGALNAGVSDVFSGAITIPAGIGHSALNVRALVESVTGETNNDNNAYVLGGATPMELTIHDIDLVLANTVTRISSSPYAAGGMATLSVTVSNRGNVASPTGGTVTFYRVVNEGLDTNVGTHALSTAIAAGSSEKVEVEITLGAAGSALYYAEITGVTDETDTSNNRSRLLRITISTPPPLRSPHSQ